MFRSTLTTWQGGAAASSGRFHVQLRTTGWETDKSHPGYTPVDAPPPGPETRHNHRAPEDTSSTGQV